MGRRAPKRAEASSRQPKPQVLAFGFDVFGTSLNVAMVELEECDLHFEEFNACPAWDRYDLVIFEHGVFLGQDLRDRPLPQEHEVRRRKKETIGLLQSGRAVCGLFDRIPQKLATGRGLLDRDDLALAFLSNALIRLFQVAYGTLSHDVQLHTIRIPEFERFIEKYGVCFNYFHLPEGWPSEAICTYGTDRRTTGFEMGHKLFFLPSELPTRRWEDVVAVVSGAAAAILRYRARVITSPPVWIGEAVFPGEKQLLHALDELNAKREEVQQQLDEYAPLKGILWASGDALVDAVCEFLKWLGIPTQRQEQYAEDFWVLQAGEDRLAVGEVKGVNGNLKNRHVTQLNHHRAAHDLDHHFPGLLIANTYRSATRLEEKDQQIEPKVRAVAQHNNVLICRTLDLFRLGCLVEKERSEARCLIDALHERGGWVKVEGDRWEIMRG